MSRVYRVPFTGSLAATTPYDIVSIQPAANKPVRLVGWVIGQTSDVGDAAEENILFAVRHMTGTVTAGTGGSAVTPVANRPGTNDYVASGATCRALDSTTVMTTSGVSTVMEYNPWNERNTPWKEWLPEELRPVAHDTEALIVRLESAMPADALTIFGHVYFEEGF